MRLAGRGPAGKKCAAPLSGSDRRCGKRPGRVPFGGGRRAKGAAGPCEKPGVRRGAWAGVISIAYPARSCKQSRPPAPAGLCGQAPPQQRPRPVPGFGGQIRTGLHRARTSAIRPGRFPQKAPSALRFAALAGKRLFAALSLAGQTGPKRERSAQGQGVCTQAAKRPPSPDFLAPGQPSGRRFLLSGRLFFALARRFPAGLSSEIPISKCVHNL